MLKQELPMITEALKEQAERLEHNHKLYTIYEGELLPYVLQDLKKQLSDKSFEQAAHRVAPVNVLKRLIDKLSKLYVKPPVRTLQSGKKPAKKGDLELYSELCESLDLNTAMAQANEFFNLFKNSFIEPYLDRGTPRIRILPSDRFMVHSTDAVNPLRPTHYSKLMGTMSVQGEKRQLIHTFTDAEFLIHDEKGRVFQELMNANDNPEGINPYGRIPGVYLSRSRNDLIPKADSDTLTMTKLFPILFSDLNFAVMFQCFSIIYGKNITQEGLVMAPNAFWNIKTDAASDGDSEIGILKPDVDTDKVLGLIKTLLAIWLESKNIKPGSTGQLSGDSFASGVSKMIDEMDTSDDRQKQVPFFVSAERELADLIINHMQPVWMSDPAYSLERRSFTQGLKLSVQFAEQKAMVDQSKVIDDQIKLMDKKLQTRKRALKAINQDLSDEDIDALTAEIDAEEPSQTPADMQMLAQGQNPDMNQGQNQNPNQGQKPTQNQDAGAAPNEN
jgi:hypothetical protein